MLRLLIAAASNQVIANTLVISLHTAKNHVASILQKLGVATRTQAALRGRDLGLAPLPPPSREALSAPYELLSYSSIEASPAGLLPVG